MAFSLLGSTPLWKKKSWLILLKVVCLIAIFSLVYSALRDNLRSKKQAYIYGNPLSLCNTGYSSNLEYILALRKPGLILDVGSFDGGDAVRYARSGGHRVLTFEPVPSKASAIREKIQNSGLGHLIEFFPVALSNYTGTADFYVSTTKLGKKKMKVSGTEQDAFTVPWDKLLVDKISVEVRELDEFIKFENVLYLKVDAQGYDAQVLFGARKAIREKRISYINFEISPGLTPDPTVYAELLSWLGEFGYFCFDCKFFKEQGLRGKSENILKMPIETFISTLNQTKLLQRGVNVKKYTDMICTLL